MRVHKFKLFYALLSLLLVVVAAQSYFIYDLKQGLDSKKDLKEPENIVVTQTVYDDFFNDFHHNGTNPFEQMRLIQEQMQKSFGHFNSMFFNDPFFKEAYEKMSALPLSDIKEDKDNYTIELNIPGVKKQEIEITSEDNYLKVHAYSVKSSDVNDTNYIHKERYTQRFERVFVLPEDADMKNLEDSYDNGILKIVIPKKR